MITIQRLVATVLAAGIAFGASSAEIYRWVDDKGVTNLSDVVPDKYKNVAQRIETPAEPNDVSRKEGAWRAAASASAASASQPVSNVRRPAVGLSGNVPGRSASAGSLSSSDDNDDCGALQRRYKESQECFGPRPRTITGAINGARSPECPVVVDPSPKCGLPNGGEGAPAPAP